MTERLETLTATEILGRAGGAPSAQALVEACLDRIDAREPMVGAWQYLDRQAAIAAAREVDGRTQRGALHGVPIGIKDVIDTADMPTGYGSELYRDHRPRTDAPVVAALRQAGAIILGKTVSTEFAYFAPGKTANPHDPLRTPGGSSSGSAAAVAAMMVPLALGTQTAGSTIRPAAFCGVFGFKPTFGVIPLDAIRPLAPSLDTLGMFARSVDDLALLAAVLSGGRIAATVREAKARHGAPRIGIVSPSHWPGASATTHALFERIEAALSGRASIESAAQQLAWPALTEAQTLVMAHEAAALHGSEASAAGDRVSLQFRQLCELGRSIGADRYRTLLRMAETARPEFDRMLQTFDFLLLPSALGEAPLKTQGTGDPVCCRALTLIGAPCVNVPAGLGSGGLPLGVQVVTARHADDDALVWAKWLAGVLRQP